jgi:addiction module HigA family antidote
MVKAALARELGVSRPTLNSLLKGKSRIRPETALRLGKLHNGPAFWLSLQLAWDLDQAQKAAAAHG